MAFRFEFLDNSHIVMLHGAGPPPPDGWRDYLHQIRGKDLTSIGLLCFTNGGAPDPTQRQELNEVIGGRYYARAIVHRSALVRGVVLAVSWFAPGVKAFSPWTWPAAAEHARFKLDDLANVASHVRRLHAGMTERIPWLDGALEQRFSLAPRDAAASATAPAEGPVNRPSPTLTRAQLDAAKGRQGSSA
jgi:hypothetical protein